MYCVMEEKGKDFVKIGIDLDGTAWEHREFFQHIISLFLSANDEITILTSHVNLYKEDMKLWIARGFPSQIKYYSKQSGEEGVQSREWKINKAKELGLDYIFDDFDTGEVRLVRVNE